MYRVVNQASRRYAVIVLLDHLEGKGLHCGQKSMHAKESVMTMLELIGAPILGFEVSPILRSHQTLTCDI